MRFAVSIHVTPLPDDGPASDTAQGTGHTFQVNTEMPFLGLRDVVNTYHDLVMLYVKKSRSDRRGEPTDPQNG